MLVAVENCANFAEWAAGGGAPRLAACSGCAGDYEDPELTAPPTGMPVDSHETHDNEDSDLERMRERATEEDRECEQSDETE